MSRTIPGHTGCISASPATGGQGCFSGSRWPGTAKPRCPNASTSPRPHGTTAPRWTGSWTSTCPTPTPLPGDSVRQLSEPRSRVAALDGCGLAEYMAQPLSGLVFTGFAGRQDYHVRPGQWAYDFPPNRITVANSLNQAQLQHEVDDITLGFW